MAAQKGNLVILKIGDGGGSEIFTIIGGMLNTGFELNNTIVDVTNKSSGKWREVLSGAGTSRIKIEGQGIFLDSVSEELLRSKAFDGVTWNYELTFGNGNILSGPFIISTYERSGEVSSEEIFSIGLESAGAVSFV